MALEYSSSRLLRFAVLTCLGLCFSLPTNALAQKQTSSLDSPSTLASQYETKIRPLLEDHCFACHADGADEGNLSFDRFADTQELVSDRELWWKILKNVRAGVMPPSSEAKPETHEIESLVSWIKTEAFNVDPTHPDPGRVTVRRLNRTEYRNTVRELLGIEFNAEILFPPDETGFGFDNVGDALSLSPMMLEKYLQAAEAIVEQAVPTERWVIPTQQFSGKDFRSKKGKARGDALPNEAARVRKRVRVKQAGNYELQFVCERGGSFNFNNSRYRIEIFDDDELLHSEEYGWGNNVALTFNFNRTWATGDHVLAFELTPLPEQPDSEQEGTYDATGTFVRFEIHEATVKGPLGREHWIHPDGYDRFFTRDEPPHEATEKREYARQLLSRFAERAFRRPPLPHVVDRLIELAESNYDEQDSTFERGISRAMTAVLASPRFLFRFEESLESDESKFPFVDEYALASRLSYFLWNTQPDEELFELAGEGQLRSQLDSQITRLLQDPRSNSFIRSFVSQWLRTREAENVSIDALSVYGVRDEWQRLRELRRRKYLPPDDPLYFSEEEFEKHEDRYRELGRIRSAMDVDVRIAMREETELLFEHIVQEDRSLLEMLDNEYTFLNEPLAELYGIDGIDGDEMRKIMLPVGSHRGGILTQASVLAVTSNPTRTSPVKRGLYVLDNVLGTPSPPAPPNVPELEEAAERFEGREPTLREILSAHREDALCSSCHSRMDPLGLALENFNALGQWRRTEKSQPIETAGELITGEAFEDIEGLKKILAKNRGDDFFRCVTQKMMIYALGRGLEYYDEYTIDEIAKAVAQSGGKPSVLIREIIHSSPFQRTRRL